MDTDFVSTATQFIARYGWGAQGKMLGISRMFQEADMNLLKKEKLVASLRPRGILSGFLAIVPALKSAIYLPPIAGKTQPKQIRMRLSDDLLQTGAILSCYWSSGNELILEDILVWKGASIWQKMPFSARWSECMRSFADSWQPDTVLQNCQIRFAEFLSLESLQKPSDREVIEFIPDSPHAKRMIWLTNEQTEMGTHTIQTVHRESQIGPDIFSVWSDKGERLGIAYIKSLAMSRQLRLHDASEFKVKTAWNKMFERHEILGLA